MDISRMANIASVNQTTLTHSSEHRTMDKSSTLATEHTDAFIKSQATFTPAYTKRSAQKQASDNNLTQREDSEDKVGAVKQNEGKGKAELMVQGVQHIIRAMLVKQGEVLTGNVPSVGAKLYAEELLSQIRRLYGNPAEAENTPEYWSPENTAERLITFFDCVSVEGDKYNLLDRSFKGAFADTEQLFGGRGRLPLESYETKQLVLDNYFNKPENNGNI
ncbi:MAG: hypothetical protein J6A19_04460 [Oscillospiraceae bacterium]|nr:hypothetical protein [Oscillospiraceae bacterium]